MRISQRNKNIKIVIEYITALLNTFILLNSYFNYGLFNLFLITGYSLLILSLTLIIYAIISKLEKFYTIIGILLFLGGICFIFLDRFGSGKPIPWVQKFDVNMYYSPSGKMGDIGDVTIGNVSSDKSIGFTYKTAGKGDLETGAHEYEWKYISDGKTLSQSPAQFGGLIWLDTPNDWGTKYGGYDLRGFKYITWEARSKNDPVTVEFVIGGIEWYWTETESGKFIQAPAPYKDTMPRISLGNYKLTNEWKRFEIDLSHLGKNYFKRLRGGFGWTASWGNNGVSINDTGVGPNQVRTLEFEMRNIFYLKNKGD